MNHASLLAKLGVLIVPDFFDAGTCARLCDEMRRASLEFGKLARDGGRLDLQKRKTMVAQVAAETRTEVIRRLLRAKPRFEEFFADRFSTWVENPKFLIYEAGNYFVPHRDVSPFDTDEVQKARRINLVIHLNDDYETEDEPRLAALTLWDLVDDPRWKHVGFPIPGTPGLLVAFRSHVLHSVAPIVRGSRLVILSRYFDARARFGPEYGIADEPPDAS